MERNFDNAKDLFCVVTDMEDPMKTFEESNMMWNLYEEEEKSILNKKRLELALTIYMDRDKIIKENMKTIYGIVFGQFTLSLQSMMKWVPDHDKK